MLQWSSECNIQTDPGISCPAAVPAPPHVRFGGVLRAMIVLFMKAAVVSQAAAYVTHYQFVGAVCDQVTSDGTHPASSTILARYLAEGTCAA